MIKTRVLGLLVKNSIVNGSAAPRGGGGVVFSRVMGLAYFVPPLIVGAIFAFDFLFVSYFIDDVQPRYPFYIMGLVVMGILIAGNGLRRAEAIVVVPYLLLFLLIFVSICFSYVGVGGRVSNDVFLRTFYAAFIVPLFFFIYGFLIVRNAGNGLFLGYVLVQIIIFSGSLYLNLYNLFAGEGFRPAYYRYESEYLLDMHYFADFSLVLAIVYLSQGRPRGVLLFFLALLSALFLGSRTPFLFGVISYLIFLYLHQKGRSKKSRKSVVYIFGAAGLGVLFFGVYLLGADGSGGVFDRFVSFEKILNDWDDRGSIVAESFNYFGRCFFFGCFPFESIFLLSEGRYIHNWLSFLASYGVFALIFFVVLFVRAFMMSFSSRDEAKRRLPVLCFLLLSIVLSRGYIWPYWAMIMIYVSMCGPSTGKRSGSF